MGCLHSSGRRNHSVWTATPPIKQPTFHKFIMPIPFLSLGVVKDHKKKEMARQQVASARKQPANNVNQPFSHKYFGSMYKMYSCIDVQLLFQGKKTQETIPHECVLYFVGDFRVNNWYSVKDFRIMTNVGRTRTTNNIFKLKFTISTIIKHIPSVSTLLYFHPASFADIIHRRLDFKISVCTNTTMYCGTLMYLKLMRCVKGSSHLNRTTHQDRVMVVLEAQKFRDLGFWDPWSVKRRHRSIYVNQRDPMVVQTVKPFKTFGTFVTQVLQKSGREPMQPATVEVQNRR
ncbi:hypothetical protein YC2023_010667 [Brassica napus]